MEISWGLLPTATWLAHCRSGPAPASVPVSQLVTPGQGHPSKLLLNS